MAVYKEPDTNTWRVIYRYTDWTGERKQSSKRGFSIKRDALAWEREQLQKLNESHDAAWEGIQKLLHIVEIADMRFQENDEWHREINETFKAGAESTEAIWERVHEIIRFLNKTSKK